MTTISATIILDSVSPHGARLTTMELVYPRWIHGQVMTHRVFSRNASSSRAIPTERLIRAIEEDTAIPVFWGKNQAGMQADGEWDAMVRVDSGEAISRKKAWLRARDSAIASARAFAEAGYSKEIVNRLLEPFSHIRVLVSATEWANFFALRDHADAQHEIQLLARSMRNAMEASSPVQRLSHLPYLGDTRADLDRTTRFKISTARCARVSYKTHDGDTPTIDQDLALYDRLMGGNPIHASPAEHCAVVSNTRGFKKNFRGWTQFRHLVEKGYV